MPFLNYPYCFGLGKVNLTALKGLSLLSPEQRDRSLKLLEECLIGLDFEENHDRSIVSSLCEAHDLRTKLKTLQERLHENSRKKHLKNMEAT